MFLWQNHLVPSNPYPQTATPPPFLHKVWILDCKSCGSFLTNRGMKAVLLLRPNVSLYSTDAMPLNCSPYTCSPDVLRAPSACRPPSHIPRTCECLTQSLCCHGCGSPVGYMIVIPCSRCTSSITSTNRATNGHRFVFHSTEIQGTERLYIEQEPGILPYEPAAAPAPFHPAREGYLHYFGTQVPSTTRPGFLPTPPLDASELSPVSSPSPSPVNSQFPSLGSQAPQILDSYVRNSPFSVPSQSHYHPSPSSSDISSDSGMPPLLSPSTSFSSYSGLSAPPPQRILQAGDIVYWHHLMRHGEIPGVSDDPRARKQPSSECSVVKQLIFDR
ncbi:FAM72 protein-domain-containing protein [Mycena floridula]|nr:FAM72 protein-domain-containing protein [Mycena floridula]